MILGGCPPAGGTVASMNMAGTSSAHHEQFRRASRVREILTACGLVNDSGIYPDEFSPWRTPLCGTRSQQACGKS